LGSSGKYKKDYNGFYVIEELILCDGRWVLSACAIDVHVTGFEYGPVMESSEDRVGEPGSDR
jgi:hypothetical protein